MRNSFARGQPLGEVLLSRGSGGLAAVDDLAFPIVNVASSEQNHSTAAAISWGLRIRPIGSLAMTAARPSSVSPVKRRIISVSMMPGQMALMALPGRGGDAVARADGSRAKSDEFRQLWAAHNVRLHTKGVKRFDHPVVGELELSFNRLEVTTDPGLTIVTYSAELGSRSSEALDLLSSWAATEDAAPA